ncbi:MAG: glutamate racemase [Cetobacterium sp.]|nr:glutamate racemase [Cetobacterium sp.]
MYKIGVFDSGVGGLTVLKEIEALLPNSHIIYFADNANSPYGDKTGDEITKLCIRIAYFLTMRNVDAIVIACNTATAAAFETLKNKFNVPIIGVIEPGVRTALKASKNGDISVIGTLATMNLNAYKKTFFALAGEKIKITQRGCKLLCPMIENGWIDKYTSYFTDEILRLYLEGISENSDTLILGCTHYPLIKDDIRKFFTKTIIDPAHETALELLHSLKNNEPKNKNIKPLVQFIVSGEINNFRKIAEKFLKRDISNIIKMDISY